MTNFEKAEQLGIADDLLENHTKEAINNMSPESILNAWLEWEGIYGYTSGIISIIETFFMNKDEEN